MRFGNSCKRKHQQVFHQPAIIESLESRQLLTAVIEAPPQPPADPADTMDVPNDANVMTVALNGNNANGNELLVNETLKELKVHLVYAQMSQLAYADDVTDTNLQDEYADARAGVLGDWKVVAAPGNDANGFRFVVFKGKKDQGYVIAFAGTEGISWQDWEANGMQAFRMKAAQYDAAMEKGLEYQRKINSGELKGPLHFTGHSLGGGLASAASMATRALKDKAGKTTLSPATTFNAAGVHMKTVIRKLREHGLAADDYLKMDGKAFRDEQITAYRVLPKTRNPLDLELSDPLSATQLAGDGIKWAGQMFSIKSVKLEEHFQLFTFNVGRTVKIQPKFNLGTNLNLLQRAMKAHSISSCLAGLQRLIEEGAAQDQNNGMGAA